MTAKKLNHCQACWSLHLARFDFLLYHHPGRTMGKPDTLSRRADHRNRASDNENVVLLRPEFLVVRALEGVELTGMEQKILSNIRKGNQNGDQEKPIAKAARELQHSANRTVHSSEWSNIDRLLRFQGKIYVLQSPDLCRQIVALCHDTHIAGHPGHWKCHDLVKWLSHYLYFFSFLFFYLGLTTQRKVWESVMSQVSHGHGHMTGSHSVTSHWCHMMSHMIGMGK